MPLRTYKAPMTEQEDVQSPNLCADRRGSSILPRRTGTWRKWYTRRVQDPVGAILSRFDSGCPNYMLPWWNGRHAALRTQCRKRRPGSNPGGSTSHVECESCKHDSKACQTGRLFLLLSYIFGRPLFLSFSIVIMKSTCRRSSSLEQVFAISRAFW